MFLYSILGSSPTSFFHIFLLFPPLEVCVLFFGFGVFFSILLLVHAQFYSSALLIFLFFNLVFQEFVFFSLFLYIAYSFA